MVQMAVFGPEVVVQRVDLKSDQSGSWTVPLDETSDRAVISVSGLAPVTTEWASYSYEITE
jgi:hypothetical protein